MGRIPAPAAEGNVPEDFDLIVLGSGMGGATAAGQAAANGARVALVEREQLGGT